MEKVLVGLLNVLNLYYASAGSEEKPGDIYGSLLQIIPPLLNDTNLQILRESVKKLLQSLRPSRYIPAVVLFWLADHISSRAEYYKLKDATQMTYIAQRLQDRTKSVDAKLFRRFVNISRKVASRHDNFSSFLDSFPTFPKDLLKVFWTVFSKESAHSENFDSVALGLVEILLAYGKYLQEKSMIENSSAVHPAFSLLSR